MHRMNATRKKLGWGGLLLGSLLWALPAAAQAPSDRCEADCATKASEPVQACVRTCPQPANPKDANAMRGYQSCAARCSSRFQEHFKTCKKTCPEKKTPKK